MVELTSHQIQCLECGRWFKAIGSHIVRMHDMDAREYRIKHDLPASFKLASDELRSAQSELTKEMIATGQMNNNPLAASEAAREAGRGVRSSQDRERQAQIAKAIPRKQLPAGAKRADGRDADKARVAQQLRRARSRNK